MTLVHRSFVFAVLLVWCGVLLAYRVLRTDSLAYSFLVWNLFLAAIPLVASTLLVLAHQRGRFHLLQALLFLVWLLFLPNAPYILTDFIHLEERPGMPLWYDIALLASGAGTGVLLAYASAADVQRVVRASMGAAAGWAAVTLAFLLSGLGIYLGRFLRWNSWDALTDPRSVFGDIAVRAIDPLSYPRTLGVTIIYGIALTLGYAAVKAISLRER